MRERRNRHCPSRLLYLLYLKHLDPSSTCFSLPSCAHRLWRCVTSWSCPISDRRTSPPPRHPSRTGGTSSRYLPTLHGTCSHPRRATGDRWRCPCPSPNSSTSRWRPRLADVGIPGAHRRARGGVSGEACRARRGREQPARSWSWFPALSPRRAGRLCGAR